MIVYIQQRQETIIYLLNISINRIKMIEVAKWLGVVVVKDLH